MQPSKPQTNGLSPVSMNYYKFKVTYVGSKMRLKVTSFSEGFGAVDERALKHSFLPSRPLCFGVTYSFRLEALLTSIYVYSLLDKLLHYLLPR